VHLPRHGEAILAPEKLHAYLLSRDHPVGGQKADFFIGVLGFRRERWRQLESALRWHASSEVSDVVRTPYGTKYLIRASLTGPSGRTAWVLSVWAIDEEGGCPRFVTAYPEAPP
jgi:hypothetical protein